MLWWQHENENDPHMRSGCTWHGMKSGLTTQHSIPIRGQRSAPDRTPRSGEACSGKAIPDWRSDWPRYQLDGLALRTNRPPHGETLGRIPKSATRRRSAGQSCHRCSLGSIGHRARLQTLFDRLGLRTIPPAKVAQPSHNGSRVNMTLHWTGTIRLRSFPASELTISLKNI